MRRMRLFSCLLPFLLLSCDESAPEAGGAASGDTEWTELAGDDWKTIVFGGEGLMRWQDGVLSLDAGVELTGARYEGENLPKLPYELELEARKVAGSDFFCGLTFPVSSPDECVTLIVGGWGGGTVGISSIDGLDASENETTTYGNFEQDRWYAIRVLVEEGRLQAFLDGERIVEVATEGRRLGLRPGVIESCAPLGVAAWQTASEIREIRWRSLAD